ncbi:MAG: stimulus-sensing domain-containing protein [Alphaproteobacteria bacterium]
MSLHRDRDPLTTRRFSPLTLRILAVNALAVLILIGGLFYLGLYQGQLVDSELENLSSEAALFAALIAEGAVEEGDIQQPEGSSLLYDEFEMNPEEAISMVRRLRVTSPSQVVVFYAGGELLVDSRVLEGDVEVKDLAPPTDADFPGAGDMLNRMAQWLDEAATAIGPRPRLDENVRAWDDTRRSLAGRRSASAAVQADGSVALIAAAPVQRVKKVLGAVVLIRDGRAIDQAVAEVRRNIFQISLISLSVTALMSIYLARAIDRPLRVLAQAAQVVRRSKTREVELPDFSSRKDEIGDLSTSLREMTHSLWARLDAIESFAADVSHELKNPLASIRSALDTLPLIKDEEKREKLLAVVQHDVLRLDRLITDISDASRLDAEMSRLSHEPFNIIKTLNVLLEIHASTLEQDESVGIPLEFNNLTGKKLVIEGNESRLVQVVQNLITNALSFSPADGSVRMILTRTRDWVELVVEDDGPGIPEAKLETIFSRFYSERPKSEGFGRHSGLGLSISRQIVTAHDGELFARNRMGEDGQMDGAQFVLRLPV